MNSGAGRPARSAPRGPRLRHLCRSAPFPPEPDAAPAVKQAELKREQANLDLSTAQRTLLRNLRGFFEEAQTAREQVALLRQAVDLASESLRLNTLLQRVIERA